MESPLNFSGPPPSSTSPKPLSMGSTTSSSSQAATTSTPAAIQSSLTKSVGHEETSFAQPHSGLTSRPAVPAPQPSPLPALAVKNTLAPTTVVQPLVSTSVVSLKAPSIKAISPHAASEQHIYADVTMVDNTTSKSSPVIQASYHEETPAPVISQPVMHIIIAGIALAGFLALLTVWWCVQKRRRHRSRKVSFASQASEKEWGTSREMPGGTASNYRHSIVTYDPKPRAKVPYEDLDFGPMFISELPTEKELDQYRQETILSMTDVYGSSKGLDGSEVDNISSSPNQFMPVSEPAPCFVRNSPEHLSTLPRANLPANYVGRQPTVPGFKPYVSSLGLLIVRPGASVKMSPAEASNELQKIVERNFEALFDRRDSFDYLSGLDDTPIQSNPEHFPVLMGNCPAARKLSSLLPGANESHNDVAHLPLPSYNFKLNAA